MKNILINDIEVEVQKKYIKNLHLYILPPQGNVRISAPRNMSEDAIHMFLVSKLPWIKKHQEKFRNQPRQLQREYVSGEAVFLWGKCYQLEVVYSNTNNAVQLEGDKIIFQVRESSTTVQREKVLNEWYRENIKKEIPELLRKWQEIIGVTALEWSVKNMKTRWGTCNIRDKRIWLNLQLVKKHPQCLEYIIVHELVHLLEKKHNNNFIAYMDRFLPDWRTIKEQLNSF